MRRQKTVSWSSLLQYRMVTRAVSDTGWPMWAPCISSLRCLTRSKVARSPMTKLRASITLDLPGVI